MIHYDKLRKSLWHLKRQFANYKREKDNTELPELFREAFAGYAVKCFEVCFDVLWKDLKRYLVEDLALGDLPNTPKIIFKFADQSNVLPSPIERWIDYANARGATVHDYSFDKLTASLALAESFIDDATKLLLTMSGTPLQ